MRLSEAILLGQPLIAKPRGGQLSACALGMAAAATGTACSYCAIENKWPWIVEARDFPCDCAFLVHRPISTTQVIAHLFDQHVRGQHTHWTLEQLADYVRSIEPAEPSEAVSGEEPNQVTERAELLKV